MKRILLTTVVGPYSGATKYNKPGDEVWHDYFTSRLTKESGPFSLSAYPNGTALNLIGANLKADVTVLYHPTMEEFVEELEQGYDIVGITFIIKGLGKVFAMVAAARKHAPGTTVVIGGFGTMIANVEATGANHVVKGEGVRFMRELIGQSPDDPTHQPVVVTDFTLKVFQDYPFMPAQKVGILTHGFGCPRRCDFCATSAFYGGRHVPFTTGRALYDAMVNVHTVTGARNFWLFEEDMCSYHQSVNEFGGLIKDDIDRAFSWACFTSVKSLERWDLEELVAMGLSHAWIGIESVTMPYAKSLGGRDIGQTFDELHELGVTTTGSMIFGLDHHRPDNLQAEIDHFVRLSPSTTQIGTLMPADGTEIRRRMDAAGRLRPASYKDADLYSEILIHPNFEQGQLSKAVLDAYEQYHRRTGPGLLRSTWSLVKGARKLKRSTTHMLRRRAEIFAARARMVRPVFLETEHFLPSREARESARELLALMQEDFGAPSAEEEAMARLVAGMFTVHEARERVFPRGPIEPPPDRIRYIEGVEVNPTTKKPVYPGAPGVASS